MMDKIILEKKVDSILRCLNRIDDRIPNSKYDFLRDLDAQDVVILNLTRAVQLSVDIATHILSTTNQPIPSTMAEAFVSLERINIISSEIADKMRRSVGYRNVAVHNYDDIDLSITFDIANNHLDDFKEFIKQTLHYNSQ
jgi:uncharacterized protein YutE (UPF0331/DUF86 family)